ncbi:MAG: chloride channel protein [Anaerolineae bacterium]|nr:chloride channel protein [Anaerolineae bacterium]MDQ7036797.1 chloride channel protein [Anaerolineae bacterium]
MASSVVKLAEWRYRLKSRLERSPIANDAVPMMLSIIVGIVTGLGAFIFIRLLSFVTHYTEILRDTYDIIGSLIILGIAGLITGFIIARFASEAKGHGVPEVMEAIALKRGRIRPRVAVAKILASAMTIGSGGSAGREGPIVQVGSALGSTLGQWARLSDEQLSVLVASGAAAGIAATFNAPIAGAMFALEVILGNFSNRYLGMVVVSAVSANVVSRVLLGDAAAFRVPVYALNSPLELPLYLILAILSAIGAVLFIRILYFAEHKFDSLPLSLPIRTTIGMVLTGIVALAFPEVLGPGLEFIGQTIALDISLTIKIIIGLFIVKLLATTFTLGAGNSGGVFAPALFMGAMVGALVGQVGQQLWPTVVLHPGAFALVGMAAMFASAARAPITAIIIVLEMSNDYRLILPLLMTVVIATLLADFLYPDSIYTRKLTLRGIRLHSGQDIDLLQSVSVEDAMTRGYVTVPPDMTLEQLIPIFQASHHHGFPIVDAHNHLQGIVTLTDIEHAQEKQMPLSATTMEVGTHHNMVTAHPDDLIYLALRRMSIYNIGRLPVISREDSQTFLGMIRRSDIIKAYDIALRRKAIQQHRGKYLKLRDTEDNSFIEVTVEEGAPMVGRTLAQFPHSDNCLLVSIWRNGEAMIAHGSTQIEAGDRVIAYVQHDAAKTIQEQFTCLAVTKSPST